MLVVVYNWMANDMIIMINGINADNRFIASSQGFHQQS